MRGVERQRTRPQLMMTHLWRPVYVVLKKLIHGVLSSLA